MEGAYLWLFINGLHGLVDTLEPIIIPLGSLEVEFSVLLGARDRYGLREGEKKRKSS